MGVDQRNSYELYWTTIEYVALANFKKIMSKNRFMIILRCLHVCDNTKIDGMDKLDKIRPMLHILFAAWQAAYYPNRKYVSMNLCIQGQDRCDGLSVQKAS